MGARWRAVAGMAILSAAFVLPTLSSAPNIPEAETEAIHKLVENCPVLKGTPPATRRSDEVLWGDLDESVCYWEGVNCEEGGIFDLNIRILNKKLNCTLPNEMKALKRMRLIDITFTNVAHPNFGEVLAGWESLKYLKAGHNPDLKGPIPSLENNPSIEEFGMGHTGLSGSIPEEWTKHPGLHTIDLSHTYTSGKIPALDKSMVHVQKVLIYGANVKVVPPFPEFKTGANVQIGDQSSPNPINNGGNNNNNNNNNNGQNGSPAQQQGTHDSHDEGEDSLPVGVIVAIMVVGILLIYVALYLVVFKIFRSRSWERRMGRVFGQKIEVEGGNQDNLEDDS